MNMANDTFRDDQGNPVSEAGFILCHRVAPRLFSGIVLSPGKENPVKGEGAGRNFIEDTDYAPHVQKIVDEMMEADKEKPELLVPIYDLYGNLLWPKQMPYEEVKKLVADREKEK